MSTVFTSRARTHVWCQRRQQNTPQERDLRRTLEQIVDAVPLVPLLDDLVPQMVEQLPDVLHFFDFLPPVPEQVIEVA